MELNLKTQELDTEGLAKAMVVFGELADKLGDLTQKMTITTKAVPSEKDKKEMAQWKKNRAKKRKAKRKSGGKR